MGWRDYAKLVDAPRHDRHVRHESPAETPNVPTVPIVPRGPRLSPDRLVRQWWAALGKVDPDQPPEGFDARRWSALCRCAVWWLDGFSVQAARDGWDTGSVFGLHPAGPRLGGIVDQLAAGLLHLSERPPLVMDGSKAVWRSYGIATTYGRGAGEDLAPFWEWMPCTTK